jgi:hypothetical protein
MSPNIRKNFQEETPRGQYYRLGRLNPQDYVSNYKKYININKLKIYYPPLGDGL